MPAMNLAYVFDGSLDGFLTAVFEAYARREVPCLMVEENGLQMAFGQQITHIFTEEDKARRVERGIRKSIGEDAWRTVWTTFLSSDADKATKLYRYLRVGFSVGKRIYSHLAQEDVLTVNKLCRYVEREAHLMQEFARFSLMEGDVYYAKIEPVNSVVPLIMPHFADRFSVQPFLIHDPAHELVGVFDLQKWYLVETEHLDVPRPTEDELEYRRLWKRFYDAVAVMERYNPKCRRTHMPMRYWRNMTEMNYVERAPRPQKTAAMVRRQI